MLIKRRGAPPRKFGGRNQGVIGLAVDLQFYREILENSKFPEHFNFADDLPIWRENLTGLCRFAELRSIKTPRGICRNVQFRQTTTKSIPPRQIGNLAGRMGSKIEKSKSPRHHHDQIAGFSQNCRNVLENLPEHHHVRHFQIAANLADLPVLSKPIVIVDLSYATS